MWRRRNRNVVEHAQVAAGEAPTLVEPLTPTPPGVVDGGSVRCVRLFRAPLPEEDAGADIDRGPMPCPGDGDRSEDDQEWCPPAVKTAGWLARSSRRRGGARRRAARRSPSPEETATIDDHDDVTDGGGRRQDYCLFGDIAPAVGSDGGSADDDEDGEPRFVERDDPWAHRRRSPAVKHAGAGAAGQGLASAKARVVASIRRIASRWGREAPNSIRGLKGEAAAARALARITFAKYAPSDPAAPAPADCAAFDRLQLEAQAQAAEFDARIAAASAAAARAAETIDRINRQLAAEVERARGRTGPRQRRASRPAEPTVAPPPPPPGVPEHRIESGDRRAKLPPPPLYRRLLPARPAPGSVRYRPELAGGKGVWMYSLAELDQMVQRSAATHTRARRRSSAT